MNGFELKKILSDIVEQAYPDSPRLKAYKAFYIDVIPQKRKSFHGRYFIKERRIELYNLDRDINKLVVTALHELAHHIDNINRGTTDHQDGFYEAYQKLLYAGLDMGLFTTYGFEAAIKDDQGSKKVVKLLRMYRPHRTEYKAGKKRIDVCNAFSIKDELKRGGYHFDNILKTWFLEVEEEKLPEQEKWLESIHAEYRITNANVMTFS